MTSKQAEASISIVMAASVKEIIQLKLRSCTTITCSVPQRSQNKTNARRNLLAESGEVDKQYDLSGFEVSD